MENLTKRIEKLTIADLKTFPVWQYANDDETVSGIVVRPLKKTPVKHLTGRVVGTQVRLANGSHAWALIGNVDTNHPRLTQHFLTLSVFREGRWFTMARYHDYDYKGRGPKALSKFLGSSVDEIFPISYDISRACFGDPGALIGTIEREPRERLTRAEIIGLAVP